MSEQWLLSDSEQIKALAERLMTCEQVVRYDTDEEKEAWTLTHTFSDLEKSFHTYLTDLLPRLCRGELSAADVCDTLLDIGEELRHILYHLEDTKFYAYIADKDDGGG
jgi:hypothetical protein